MLSMLFPEPGGPTTSTGIRYLFVPAENAAEATLSRGPMIIPVSTVRELADGLNGLKELPCVLRGYEDGKITVESGKDTITFEKSQVALVRLRVEF